MIENVADLVNVFPNPAKNQVNISSANINDAQVSVISSEGQIIQLPLGIVNDGMLTLDISTVPNGVYFLRIVQENKVVTEKFVINK